MRLYQKAWKPGVLFAWVVVQLVKTFLKYGEFLTKSLKKSHFKSANLKFNDIDNANLKNLRTPEV